MSNRDTSPLLELLDQRWKGVIKDLPDMYRRPSFTSNEVDRLRENARLHAQADSSDPFAYGRAMRRQRSGEWLPSELRTDALAKIAVRSGVGVVIPISLS